MENIQVLRIKEKTPIVLMPHHLKNIQKSIQNVIPKMLFTCRTNNQQPSIVISVKKVNIVSDCLETFDDYPQMLIDIEYLATLLVLHPGALVKGVLVQQFSSHMIIQIFQIFNVIIQEEEINNKTFTWNEENSSFINKQNEIVEIGTEIQIKILEVIENQTDPKMFEIKGSIKDRKNTGQLQFLDNKADEYAQINQIIAKSLEYIN